jgi:hypothetical protein
MEWLTPSRPAAAASASRPSGVVGVIDDGKPQHGVAEAGEPEDRERPP